MNALSFAIHLLAVHQLAHGVLHQVYDSPSGQVHVLRVPAPYAAQVHPAVAPHGRQSLIDLASGGVAAINGGYFDPRTAAPVSWVLRDGHWVSDPHQNTGLMQNPKLQPYLETINRRTEWRALSRGDGWRWQLAPHGSATPIGWTLRHAVQAGPRLLPAETVEQEAFVRPGADPLNVNGRTARSGLGVTSVGELVLAMSPAGFRLADLALCLQQLGCVDAMGLDGGSSSQMAWKDSAGWHIVGAGNRQPVAMPGLVSAIVVGD